MSVEIAEDCPLSIATRQVEQAIANIDCRPVVECFFDETTSTVTHIVSDPSSGEAAIIDPVLDYDGASGRVSSEAAERIIAYVNANSLKIVWLIETHAHADHLSAAPFLQERLGGMLAIGKDIVRVQETFDEIFPTRTDFRPDGAQFDHLFGDGETFRIGSLHCVALHVPGHTPADTAYIVGDAAFVGDTMFMPDCGTARADFPGGDARQLFRSIRRLLALPDETRMFVCHDYKAPGRSSYAWETTVARQRLESIHVRDGVSEAEFVSMRNSRDQSLAMPSLIIPSIQVNIRGGRLPDPDDNGIRYIRIPINAF